MSEIALSHRQMSAKEKVVRFATNVRDSIRNAFESVVDRLTPNKREKDEAEKQLQHEVFSKAVARAQNWRQLFQAIELIGSIPTSSSERNFSAVEVKNRIHTAYHSNDKMQNAAYVPRAYGLRSKYEQLVAQSISDANNATPDQVFAQRLPAWNEYVWYYDSVMRDPGTYDSNTVDAAVDEICIRFHSLRERKQTMQSLIRLAANVVEEVMPYDFVGMGAAADQFSSVTEAIKEAGMGVCRHQAPLLTAILKQLGFDVHQVLHYWRGAKDGHTLAYVSNEEIKAFINPGSSLSKLVYIPADKYSKHAFGWRVRSHDGGWVPAPHFENVPENQAHNRPAMRIISKLRSIFSARKLGT